MAGVFILTCPQGAFYNYILHKPCMHIPGAPFLPATVDILPHFCYYIRMQIEKLRLKHTRNMRDIGGFPAADGKKIRPRKLIRSGRLYKLPKSTVKALEDMGVDTVVDFRIQREIDDHPACVLPFAEYFYLPLMCTATPGITTGISMAHTMHSESKRIEEEFGTGENYILEMYRHILFAEYSKPLLKKVFDLLAEERSCIIFNCNSGKDRTGLVAMLIEGVLGVDRQLIVEDYLATRRFQIRRRRIQRLGLAIVPGQKRFKELLYAMMDAKPEYIEGVLDDIHSKYGGIPEYVRDYLGVPAEQIEKIRNYYLE